MVILLWLGCPGSEKETAETGDVVTFSEDIQFVFDRNCAFSGCHLGKEPEQEMDLSNGNAYASIVGVPSTQVPSLNRIEPGDPEASYLYLKLNDRQEEVGGEGTRMPPKLFLSPPELDEFRDWILAGAPEN